MRGEDNFLSEKFVVRHQQGAVEELYLVIPQDVKRRRLSRRCIAN